VLREQPELHLRKQTVRELHQQEQVQEPEQVLLQERLLQ
jgi:hypothetical protein